VDFDVGAGGFDCYDLPGAPAGENVTIWPRIAVDASDNMVVVAHTDSVIGQPSSVPCPRHYSRSTDGGANWSAWAPIDTFIGLSTNIFASKISDKFCITWGTDSLENGLYNGHIVYKISTDGGADWGNVIDIMGLIPLPSGKVYGFENMRNAVSNAYGIYDSQDNIHIVTDASIGDHKGPQYYYPSMSSVLWHYSSATGEMNLIATHPFPHGMAVGKTYPYYGQWMAKPVIGEDPTTKNLYAAWIEFPYDIASDTVNKYEIGEIYCSYSLDGGATWAPKLNLTMTPENCEVFLSMAPIVNEKLRFFYMYDKNNHDDIIGGALDPDTCLFLYFEAPITPGDIEVVSIEGIPDDSFNLGDTYYPIAVYTNKGTTPVSFQARFEMTNPSFTAFESGDTIVAPSIFYYDIINVDNLGAGVTDSVEFKPWVADTPIIDYGIYCNAFGTLLIDAELSDNQKRKDVGIEEEVVESPALFALSQSYPNPLGRGTASIRYEVPRDAQVSIKVYDIAGKLVATLVDRSHKAGTYTTNWNRKDSTGKEVPTGVYFYRLSTDKFATTKKLLLVR